MKCKNCGTEIESGLVYCPSCGKSIQLVPDYNVLEEELLSKIVEDKDASGRDKFATGVYKPVNLPNEKESEKTTTEKSKSIDSHKLLLICGTIAFAIVFIICVVSIIYVNNSKSFDYLLKEAERYESNASYSNAADYYKLAFEADSSSLEAIIGLGRMYYMAKEYQSSLDSLHQALELDDTNTEIYEYMIKCYVAMDDKQAIYELYNSAPSAEIKSLVSEFIVTPPDFSLEPGDYDEEIVLFLTSKSNYQIYYTTDGKDPTKYGKKYKESIKFSDGCYVVKAVCLSDDGQYSYIISGEYNVSVKRVDMPIVSSSSGNYTYPLCITISYPANCKCYYTLDGSEPTVNSTPYTGDIILPFGKSTLKCINVDNNGTVSPVYTGEYNCEVANN